MVSVLVSFGMLTGPCIADLQPTQMSNGRYPTEVREKTRASEI